MCVIPGMYYRINDTTTTTNNNNDNDNDNDINDNDNNNNNDDDDDDNDDDRKWQDYVYIQCEYKSTKQKIKHLLREENKVKENKIS